MASSVNVHFENDQGAPIDVPIQVDDPLTEASFGAFVQQVICCVQPAFNQDQCRVTLKAQPWPASSLVPIFDAEGLAGAIQNNALIFASVDLKVASSLAAARPEKVNGVEPVSLKRPPVKASAAAKRGGKRVGNKKVSGKRGGAPGEGLNKILRATAELELRGQSPVRRSHVALLSGYKGKRHGFTKNLTELRKSEYITLPSSDTICLTEAGMAASGVDATAPTDNVTVQESIKEQLSPKARTIFTVLLDGRVHRRADLAVATGYNDELATGFVKCLGNMSTMGILYYPKNTKNPKDKLVHLTDACFPSGRPAAAGTTTIDLVSDEDHPVEV